VHLSPPLSTTNTYSGGLRMNIEVGKLYAVSDAGIEEYNPLHCPLTGTNCKSSCLLLINNQCQYLLSLKPDIYRSIDNMLFFESPTIDALSKTDKLVVGGQKMHPIVSATNTKKLVEVKI